ncbi:MAG: hypothetical protein ACHQF2_02020 [Flavobacteriales bacterium]
MRTLLLFCYLLFPFLQVSGQAPKQPFVKLKFGEPILGNSVIANQSIFKIKSVTINDTTYDESMVMFFRNSQGQLHGSVNGRLRTCVHEEKLIIFMIQGSYNSYRAPAPGGFGMTTRTTRSKNRFFYSPGLVPVKRVTVNNLLMDVRDDMVAFKYITQAKKLRAASFISYGVALGAVIYTIATPRVTSSTSNLSTTSNNRFVILGGTILVATLTGAICNAAKWAKIRQGVHTYCGYTIYR